MNSLRSNSIDFYAFPSLLNGSPPEAAANPCERASGTAPRWDKSATTRQVAFETAALLNNGAALQNNTATVLNNIAAWQNNIVAVLNNIAALQNNIAAVLNNTAALQNNTATALNNIAALQNNTAAALNNTAALQNNIVAVLNNIAAWQNNIVAVLNNIAAETLELSGNKPFFLGNLKRPLPGLPHKGREMALLGSHPYPCVKTFFYSPCGERPGLPSHYQTTV
ncbi:MAG: hypothetical protein LBP98_00470 [Tannerella sp.]|jgi:hypothetical protein|nr:hypothetical protein [Tannerella sp.]